MKQEFYGLTAFKQFIRDLRDPEIRSKIDPAYINCHAIIFQLGGRYWLGQYLKQIAGQFTGDVRKRLTGIGDLYIKVHDQLKRFKEFDIFAGKNEGEVQEAVDWLEEAFHADERILEGFSSLQNIL